MSRRVEKLTVIGGGSAYAPGLIAALIHHAPRLHLRELRLYDIDESHLVIVARLAKAMISAAKLPWALSATSNMWMAVTGADVVLNSARPGGFVCRRLDETLPLEQGILGQETIGPGGFFFALRSVPAALELAATMRSAAAPGSLLLNYTNPTNIVTQALVDRGARDVLGLCDQFDEDLTQLATALHRPGARRSFLCTGLNHATWYSEILLDGEPLPRALPREVQWGPELDEEHRKRYELCLEIARAHPGFWPNSYLPYYEAPQTFAALARRAGPRTDAIVARLEGYYEHFVEQARQPRPELRHHRGSAGFGDLAVRTLLALSNDDPMELVLNVQNRGVAPGRFDESTVVETVVSVGKAGLQPRTATALPAGAAELQEQLESYQRLAAEAASRGSGEHIEAALAENPLVPSRAVAAAMLRRARESYGDQLTALARKDKDVIP